MAEVFITYFVGIEYKEAFLRYFYIGPNEIEDLIFAVMETLSFLDTPSNPVTVTFDGYQNERAIIALVGLLRTSVDGNRLTHVNIPNRGEIISLIREAFRTIWRGEFIQSSYYSYT